MLEELKKRVYEANMHWLLLPGETSVKLTVRLVFLPLSQAVWIMIS